MLVHSQVYYIGGHCLVKIILTGISQKVPAQLASEHSQKLQPQFPRLLHVVLVCAETSSWGGGGGVGERVKFTHLTTITTAHSDQFIFDSLLGPHKLPLRVHTGISASYQDRDGTGYRFLMCHTRTYHYSTYHGLAEYRGNIMYRYARNSMQHFAYFWPNSKHQTDSWQHYFLYTSVYRCTR